MTVGAAGLFPGSGGLTTFGSDAATSGVTAAFGRGGVGGIATAAVAGRGGGAGLSSEGCDVGAVEAFTGRPPGIGGGGPIEASAGCPSSTLRAGGGGGTARAEGTGTGTVSAGAATLSRRGGRLGTESAAEGEGRGGGAASPTTVVFRAGTAGFSATAGIGSAAGKLAPGLATSGGGGGGR